MGDMAEGWHDHHEESKTRRANNRDKSAQMLTDKEIMYSVKNGGAHLIVEGPEGYIDFWPGTGKWIVRDKNKTAGFGVRNLLRYIKEGEFKVSKSHGK